MTHSEKIQCLFKLLKIATENGYNTRSMVEKLLLGGEFDDEIIISGIKLMTRDYQVSLNDLVTHTNTDSVAFISSNCITFTGALCKYSDYHFPNVLGSNSELKMGSNTEDAVIFGWLMKTEYFYGGGHQIIVRPSEERLDFLLQTFSHLLK